MSESQKAKDDAAKKAAEEAEAAKAAKKARRSDSDDAPKPAWQAPDYDGPLDAEQAAWRNKHKATWRDPATKTSDGGDAK